MPHAHVHQEAWRTTYSGILPRDVIEANKWLNLSTAAAPPRAREARTRIRDAVTTKMTRGEIAQARLRALEWVPSRERK